MASSSSSSSSSLALPVPPKALDALLRVLVRTDILRDPTAPVLEPTALHEQLFLAAGVKTTSSTSLAFSQGIQRFLARAVYHGWTVSELAMALDATDMPKANKDTFMNFWTSPSPSNASITTRQECLDAVSARTTWRPQLGHLEWSVHTATADSGSGGNGNNSNGSSGSGSSSSSNNNNNNNDGGGEPSVILEISRTNNIAPIRVEASKEMLAQALSSLSALRREAGNM